MGFSYDPGSDIGKVRMLIPDRTAAAHVFEDEELSAYLGLADGPMRAAALALETVASDMAITLRITTVLGLSVNGAAASDAVLRRANALRAQADAADANAGGAFDWAEFALDPFGTRAVLWNARLREGV